MCVRRFWALGSWKPGFQGGLAVRGGACGKCTARLCQEGSLPLASGFGGTSVRRHQCPAGCWASRPGHRVAQEQFSPRMSLPLPPCDPDFLQPGFQTREGYGGDRGPASGEAQGTATAAPDSPSPCPWILDPRAVLTLLCSQALTPRLGAGSTDQPALGADCTLHSASSLLTVLGAPSSPGPTPEVRVSSPSLSKSDLGNLSTFSKIILNVFSRPYRPLFCLWRNVSKSFACF